jgi:hypothetical protein
VLMLRTTERLLMRYAQILTRHEVRARRMHL